MSPAKPAPLEVFVSFAPEDQAMHDALEKQLAQLERDRKIQPWHEGKIGAGEEREKEIARRLASADIVLLLVSADFLASNKRYEGDVKHAMKRHAQGAARVVPIILRPCVWEEAAFGSLEALPPGGKPVTRYEDQDVAFDEIARGLRAVVDGLAKGALGVPASRSRPWKRAVAGAVLVGLAGLAAFLLSTRNETAPPNAQLPSSAPAPTQALASPPVPSPADPGNAPSASDEPSSAPGRPFETDT